MKKLVFLLLVLLTFAIFATTSQSVFSEKVEDQQVYMPIIQKSFGAYWSKIYEDRTSWYTFQTHDNNLISINQLNDYNNDKYFITKLTKDGILLWEKSLPSQIRIASGIETSNGNIIIVGRKIGSNPLSYSENRLWIGKFNPNGILIWQKEYSHAQDWSSGSNLIETNDGNFLITGSYDGYHLLLKINPEGTIIWQKTFGNADDFEMLFQIQKSDDGSYFITGITEPMPDVAEQDTVIIKVDSQGNILWHKQIGIEEINFVSDFEILSNGDSIYASSTSLGIFRLDSRGNLLWAKDYGWGGSRDIHAISENQFYVTGFMRYSGAGFEDHGLLLSIDGNGTPLWSKQYSLDSSLSQIFAIDDEGLFMTGHANSAIWFLKTDLSGEIPNASCPIITPHTLDVQEFTPNFAAITQTVTDLEFTLEDTSYIFPDSDTVFPQEQPFCGG